MFVLQLNFETMTDCNDALLTSCIFLYIVYHDSQIIIGHFFRQFIDFGDLYQIFDKMLSDRHRPVSAKFRSRISNDSRDSPVVSLEKRKNRKTEFCDWSCDPHNSGIDINIFQCWIRTIHWKVRNVPISCNLSRGYAIWNNIDNL